MRVMQNQIISSIILISFILASIFIQTQNSIVLPNVIQDTITLSLGVLYEALPFVILGIILSTLIQTYLRQSTLIRLLPKKPVFRRAALSFSGTFMPVCECGNVPLARGLMIKGLRPQDVITFLLAAPIINPVTILTTIHAFSTNKNVVIIRVIAAFLIANIIGWLLNNVPRNQLITDNFEAVCHESSHKKIQRKLPLREHIQIFASRFREESETLIPSLVMGSVIAGVIQTLIPRSILTSISSEPVLAIFMMIVLAFIVSICANVDAFFALSLSGIFPMSAIIAFLVFGPMIDIKILSLLRTTYTPRALATITVLVFMGSMLTGLVVHYAI